MFPPLPEIIHKALLAERRPPTGKLHCSSHAHWPLRFTQLSQAAPMDESDFGSLITMKLGTLTHEWFGNVLETSTSITNIDQQAWSLVGTEIDLTNDLPDGWTGTCDFLFEHRPSGRYVVGDLKTAKPEALAYLNGSPKPEHVTQVSCYHAALSGDYDLDPDLFVCYVPKGKTSKQETIQPVVVTAPAITGIFDRLNNISASVKRYLAEVERTGELVNDALAPMPEPDVKVYWNKTTNVWDVKEYPCWQETYIGSAWDETLVPRTSIRKVGHWTQGLSWVPMKGRTVDNPPMPSRDEIERRRN